MWRENEAMKEDMNPFHEYLVVLNQIRVELEHLSGLAQEKTAAVRSNDLLALDQVMRQEQAAALTFRGLEQKQTTLLHTIGLEHVPLSTLAESFPPEMRLEAKQVVEDLRSQFQIYRSCSESARSTLECNLHEIDKILAQSANSVEGPGYEAKSPDIPTSMKTDFRA